MNTVGTLAHFINIVPAQRPPVSVFKDDDNTVYCNEFGEIHSWKPLLQSGHRSGRSRRCIHRLEPMPQNILFGADWCAQLTWCATICGNKHPVIASRKHDVVTCSFDVLGPIVTDNGYRCEHRPTAIKPDFAWQYRLYRIRWWDDKTPCDNVYLGVWPD